MDNSNMPFKEEPCMEDLKENCGQPLHSLATVQSQASNVPLVRDACSRAVASPAPPEVNKEDQDNKADLAPLGLYQISGQDTDRDSVVETTESSISLPESAYTLSSNYTDPHSIDCDTGPSDSPSIHANSLIPVHNLKEAICDTPEDLKSGDNLPLPHSHEPSAISLDILSENPMAGMLALVTASELPQAGALTTLIEAPSSGISCCPRISLLESSAAEGMALLSQLAELEMQKHYRDTSQGKALLQNSLKHG